MAHIYAYEKGPGTFDAPADKKRCRASVHNDYGVGSHQCARKPKVFDDEGLGWCTQHSPEAVAAKKAKREAKWKAETDRFNRKVLFSRVGRAFVEAMEAGDAQAACAAAERAMGRG